MKLTMTFILHHASYMRYKTYGGTTGKTVFSSLIGSIFQSLCTEKILAVPRWAFASMCPHTLNKKNWDN
jgi:hypothetical protein